MASAEVMAITEWSTAIKPGAGLCRAWPNNKSLSGHRWPQQAEYFDTQGAIFR
jgi:hypothetical protein